VSEQDIGLHGASQPRSGNQRSAFGAPVDGQVSVC
jgi:hypothetical protein